jgi:hypothetical protein
MVSTSPNSSDDPSDISELLLLPSIVAMGYMTSDDHCYCWAHDMHTVATSPTVAMGVLTIVVRRY